MPLGMEAENVQLPDDVWDELPKDWDPAFDQAFEEAVTAYLAETVPDNPDTENVVETPTFVELAVEHTPGKEARVVNWSNWIKWTMDEERGASYTSN